MLLHKTRSILGHHVLHVEWQDVLDNAAIATEISLNYGKQKNYNGKFVLIRGKDFYDGQIINVRNPRRVGTYRYMSNTVPIIEGEMEWIALDKIDVLIWISKGRIV